MNADKLAPFVLGTCRMTVLDLRRSARRQEQLLEEFGADLVPDQPPLPTSTAISWRAVSRRSRSVNARSSS